MESLIERRVKPLADSIGATFVEPCDIGSDEQIKGVFAKWGEALRRDRHPGPRGGLREARGPGGHVRRHVPRRVRARPGHLGLLAGRAGARGPPVAPPGQLDHDAQLLRRREGGHPLQRDGRGQGGARGVGALPRGGPRARRHPRQRDLGRPHPHARPQAASRASASSTARSTRSRPLRAHITIEDVGANGPLPRLATCRPRSPARPCTWTAGSTSWACRRSSRHGEGRQPPVDRTRPACPAASLPGSGRVRRAWVVKSRAQRTPVGDATLSLLRRIERAQQLAEGQEPSVLTPVPYEGVLRQTGRGPRRPAARRPRGPAARGHRLVSRAVLGGRRRGAARSDRRDRGPDARGQRVRREPRRAAPADRRG